MRYDTIRWKTGKAELIDQRLLPAKTVYVACKSAEDIYEAIKKMKIRGAPAIGVAASYGVYLGVRTSRAKDFKSFNKELKKVSKYIAGSRPTARNLFWALERMERAAGRNKDKPLKEVKALLLKEAHAILAEDVEMCRQIGENGKKLLRRKMNVLTHCNAGSLATGGYGTALGVIFSSRGKVRRVYVDETRPLLQGARLTAWELRRQRIPATLICDNMAASLMAKGKIGCVVVGADRIAANGDTANKIGTYSLAVLADYHKVPFYVAAPHSTFDLSLADGSSIPIEERSLEEVKKINGRYITPKDIEAFNPAFDVTPAKLITAFITERGIIVKPNRKKIKRAGKA